MAIKLEGGGVYGLNSLATSTKHSTRGGWIKENISYFYNTSSGIAKKFISLQKEEGGEEKW